MNYFPTLGLEIHIKLSSQNKLFCPCTNTQEFENAKANTHICPICTAQPGALPILQKSALEKGLLLGMALKCQIQDKSHFDRKSYFYPDLPMGYQITQYYTPTNIEGEVDFFVHNFEELRTIRIKQAHLETDTAKMVHTGGKAHLDFNRAGSPLVEIVTYPDFHDAESAVEFLKELQRIVRINDISDADMEKGQLRVDVNLSLAPEGSQQLGTKVELKNINSFGMIKRAIEHEIQRQSQLLEAGEQIIQETRRRDDGKGESFAMRSKADAIDYRYVPEPDIPPLLRDDGHLQTLKKQLKELTSTKIKRFREEYTFNKEMINALMSNLETLEFFENCVNESFDPKMVAKRIAGPINAYLKDHLKTIHELPLSHDQIKGFFTLIMNKNLNDTQAKTILEEMFASRKNALEVYTEKGFDAPTLSDEELGMIIDQILASNSESVKQYREGKTGVMGFLIGQVMKQTGGKLQPQHIQGMILIRIQ